MRRAAVIAVVILSLALLPAAMAGDAERPRSAMPQWTGCHAELQITVTDDGLAVTYDESKLYQHYTYWVRSYGGSNVCKVRVVELRHTVLDDPARRAGLRDIDSLRRFYRSEYSNQITTDKDKHPSFIEVFSGPEGYLVEIITLIPIGAAPAVQGDKPVKEAEL